MDFGRWDYTGPVRLNLVIERRKHIFTLHALTLNSFDSGRIIAYKINNLYNPRYSLISFRRWTTKRLIHTGRVKVITFRNTDPETGYPSVTTPIVIINSRLDTYFTHLLREPDHFPSASELRHLYYAYQSDISPYTSTTAPLSRSSTFSSRTIKTIMVRTEISKTAVVLFLCSAMLLATVAGVIIALCTGRYEAGIGVTAAIVAIMTVVQGFL